MSLLYRSRRNRNKAFDAVKCFAATIQKSAQQHSSNLTHIHFSLVLCEINKKLRLVKEEKKGLDIC